MPTDDCRPSTIEYDDDFDDDGDAEPRFGKPDLASAVTARPARHSPILSRPEAISSPGTAARVSDWPRPAAGSASSHNPDVRPRL